MGKANRVKARDVRGVTPARPEPAKPTGYPPDWRIELKGLEAKRQAITARERELVREAISAGATWSAIGNVLGIARQSAHQRFHKFVRS